MSRCRTPCGRRATDLGFWDQRVILRGAFTLARLTISAYEHHSHAPLVPPRLVAAWCLLGVHTRPGSGHAEAERTEHPLSVAILCACPGLSPCSSSTSVKGSPIVLPSSSASGFARTLLCCGGQPSSCVSVSGPDTQICAMLGPDLSTTRHAMTSERKTIVWGQEAVVEHLEKLRAAAKAG